MKLCECGCGVSTPIAKQTHTRWGYKKGEQVRFIAGHNLKNVKGPVNHNWKGGRSLNSGRMTVFCEGHPRAYRDRVYEAIIIAEKSLGKYLPEKAEVHHINRDPLNNSNCNLVLCNDKTYHMLLHRRQRSFDACGHNGWRKCWICKQYDDLSNLYIRNGTIYHRKCCSEYNKARSKQNGTESKPPIPNPII